MTHKIYLSIGSNLGDRRGFIAKAVEALRGFGSLRVSGEYASSADGFESENGFINVAAELTIDFDGVFGAEAGITFLRRIQALERAISKVPHRNGNGSYRDREIDIDIIAIEGLRMKSPELTLPHPRAAERDFVVRPLSALITPAQISTLLTPLNA